MKICRAALRTRPLGLLAVSALGALALSGCAAFDSGSDSGGSGGAVQVAAAFYPLEYVAARVAGEHAEVEGITPAGKEPHDAELSIRETALVSDADLLVVAHGFQPAVDAAVEQSSTGAVVDAAHVLELRPVEEEHAEEAHSEEAHAHEEHEHGEDGEHEHDQEEPAESEHDHDHGDVDPHFWHDPLLMADLGDAVAEELEVIDPDHAADYEANAAVLRADLEQLDGELSDGLAECERDVVVVSHDAFGYLTRYGLHFEPVAGLSPDAEPTPADLQRLQQLARREGVTTVFSERLASPRLTESLAADLGIRSAVLDPVEGLTEETADEDYLSLMRANLAALREANGCR